MLCERCRAEIAGDVPKLDEKFFKPRNRCVRDEFGRLTYLPQYPWELLTVLWQRSPGVVSTETLFSRLYGGIDVAPDLNVIRVWVFKVRQALENTPYVVETVYRQGYRLAHRDEAFKGRSFQRFGKEFCYA